MKLRHLEIFHAVTTCGSLSWAAETLNIPQLAASRTLKSAEMKPGSTLFQQMHGKPLPTNEAITLFERAQSIYQGFNNLHLLADSLACDPHVRITLGCLSSLGLGLVPELVTNFYQQNSNLVTTLTTEYTEALVKKLDLREIDLALMLQPMQQGEIPTTLIVEVPLMYIDRHYCQGTVDINQIDQQRWISPRPHSLSTAITTRCDFFTTRLSAQTYYVVTEFMKCGMGCSIVDIFSAQHDLTSEMIHPITPPIVINLYLLRWANVSLSPMAQRFVDFLCQRPRQQLKEINLWLYPDHKRSIAPLGQMLWHNPIN